MQLKIGAGRKRFSSKVKGGKGEAAEAGGKKRNRSTLAAANQEVAAAGVEWIESSGTKIEGTTRLLSPTQSCASSNGMRGTETSSSNGERQGGQV
jgi:hypothetical protein